MSKSAINAQSTVDMLKDEIQVALLAKEEMHVMKVKIEKLLATIREEKERRLELAESNKKSVQHIETLSVHLKKVVTYLRSESKDKVKEIDARRILKKQLVEVLKECDSQDRAIRGREK